MAFSAKGPGWESADNLERLEQRLFGCRYKVDMIMENEF